MKITAKYNPGDIVYYIMNNGICNGPVHSIQVIKGGDYSYIISALTRTIERTEEDVFSTKEETKTEFVKRINAL